MHVSVRTFFLIEAQVVGGVCLRAGVRCLTVLGRRGSAGRGGGACMHGSVRHVVHVPSMRNLYKCMIGMFRVRGIALAEGLTEIQYLSH